MSIHPDTNRAVPFSPEVANGICVEQVSYDGLPVLASGNVCFSNVNPASANSSRCCPSPFFGPLQLRLTFGGTTFDAGVIIHPPFGRVSTK